jgi:hypothetical protein
MGLKAYSFCAFDPFDLQLSGVPEGVVMLVQGTSQVRTPYAPPPFQFSAPQDSH